MPLTRPVVGADISAADFGQPVYDWIAAYTPTAWTNLTFTNGWQAFGQGYMTPRYRKIGTDMVNLQGAAKGGTASAVPGQIQIGTMPVGYRPTTAIINAVLFGGSDTWGGPGRLDVWSSGEVMVVVSSAMPGSVGMVAFNITFTTT